MKRTRTTPGDVAQQVRQSAQPRPSDKGGRGLLIPTGSTLLNLALSDSLEGGWGIGKVANLIGDSSSGKTLLALTMFAEMSRLKEFDDYRLIYDDVEHALEFNLAELFGRKMAERVESPGQDKAGEPKNSDIIQDFQCFVDDALKDGRPFVYVLDSLDALTSKQEQEKVGKMMDAHRKEAQIAGSYGMDNPKIASQMLRMIKGKVKDTSSLILIISQTRDNIDPMSFEKKTRSGGRALRFYSCHEVWLAMAGKVKGKGDRVIGNDVKFKVSKNKLTGKLREGFFTIYYDYGADDVASCIEFLEDEKHWEKAGQALVAPEFDFKGTHKALVKKIEDEGLEPKLRGIVGQVWGEIEEGLKLNRKSKYE